MLKFYPSSKRRFTAGLDVTVEAIIADKPIKPDEHISRALQKRIEQVKKLPPEKQKVFMALVDALIVSRTLKSSRAESSRVKRSGLIAHLRFPVV